MGRTDINSQDAFLLINSFADLILACDASEKQKEEMKKKLIDLSGILGGNFGAIAAYEQIFREFKSVKP